LSPSRSCTYSLWPQGWLTASFYAPPLILCLSLIRKAAQCWYLLLYFSSIHAHSAVRHLQIKKNRWLSGGWAGILVAG
jgi:hypothetical protein